MGRKGVSKRKPAKSKKPTTQPVSSNGAVSNIARISETPAAQLVGKGEGITSSRGNKKK